MVISGNTMGIIFTVAIVWLVFRGAQESFLARNDTVRQQKHSQFEGMLWPYIRALFAGWLAMLSLQALLGSSVIGLGGEAESLIVRAMTLAFVPFLALFMTPIVVVIGLVLSRLPIPSGVTYILTGLLTGLTMQCQMALNGTTNLAAAFGQTSYAFDLHGLLIALTQPAGGAVGGFVFWRAMGYPGLRRGTARALDLSQGALDAALGGTPANLALSGKRILGSATTTSHARPAKKSFGKRHP